MRKKRISKKKSPMYSNRYLTSVVKGSIENEMSGILNNSIISMRNISREELTLNIAKKLSDESLSKIVNNPSLYSNNMVNTCKEMINRKNGKFTVKIKTINGKKPDSGRSMYNEIMAMFNID